KNPITDAILHPLISRPELTNAADADLRKLRDEPFPSEVRLHGALAMMPTHVELLGAVVYPALLKLALISDCGKSALLPKSILVESPPGTGVAKEFVTAGNLSA